MREWYYTRAKSCINSAIFFPLSRINKWKVSTILYRNYTALQSITMHPAHNLPFTYTYVCIIYITRDVIIPHTINAMHCDVKYVRENYYIRCILIRTCVCVHEACWVKKNIYKTEHAALLIVEFKIHSVSGNVETAEYKFLQFCEFLLFCRCATQFSFNAMR